MHEIYAEKHVYLYIKSQLKLWDKNKNINGLTILHEVLKYQISYKFIQWLSSCFMCTGGHMSGSTEWT